MTGPDQTPAGSRTTWIVAVGVFAAVALVVYFGFLNQPDEEEVVRVTGSTTTNVIRTKAPGFFVYVGHPVGGEGPEEPTYDWLYSNLCVQLE